MCRVACMAAGHCRWLHLCGEVHDPLCLVVCHALVPKVGHARVGRLKELDRAQPCPHPQIDLHCVFVAQGGVLVHGARLVLCSPGRLGEITNDRLQASYFSDEDLVGYPARSCPKGSARSKKEVVLRKIWTA